MVYRKTLIGLTAFLFLFWFVFPILLPGWAATMYLFTLPARHLGIFVHEMGHGLSTLLTGGRFLWFQMELMSGGVAVTSGGVRGLTLLGGLLGPALFGSLLLVASTRRRGTGFAMTCLVVFFLAGIYYMLKPVFLPGLANSPNSHWSPGMLVAVVVPGFALLITLTVRTWRGGLQRLFLQVFGILMCFSAFSDTDYIFRYEQLPNGLFSDARVFASLLWGPAESVPYWLFLLVAVAISCLNFFFMILGAWRALVLESDPADVPSRAVVQ